MHRNLNAFPAKCTNLQRNFIDMQNSVSIDLNVQIEARTFDCIVMYFYLFDPAVSNGNSVL